MIQPVDTILALVLLSVLPVVRQMILIQQCMVLLVALSLVVQFAPWVIQTRTALKITKTIAREQLPAVSLTSTVVKLIATVTAL